MLLLIELQNIPLFILVPITSYCSIILNEALKHIYAHQIKFDFLIQIILMIKKYQVAIQFTHHIVMFTFLYSNTSISFYEILFIL